MFNFKKISFQTLPKTTQNSQYRNNQKKKKKKNPPIPSFQIPLSLKISTPINQNKIPTISNLNFSETKNQNLVKMQDSNTQPPRSSLSEAALDASPLLGHSLTDSLIRSRRFIRRTPPPLRGAARLLRRASGRRMMLREPSVRVRENAAEQLEERQSDWAYSKPVLVLDMLWNFAFIGVGLVVLGLSVEERPAVPLRVWVVGYVVQCLFHMGCVIVEYKKRCEARLMGLEGSGVWESGADLNLNSSSTSGSGSDGEDYGIENQQAEEETRLDFLTTLSLLFLFFFCCYLLRCNRLFNVGFGEKFILH